MNVLKILLILAFIIGANVWGNSLIIEPSQEGELKINEQLISGKANVVKVDNKFAIAAFGENFIPLRIKNNKNLISLKKGGIEVVFKLNLPPENGKLFVSNILSSYTYKPSFSGMALGFNRNKEGKTFIWFFPVDLTTKKKYGFYNSYNLNDNKFHTVKVEWDGNNFWLIVDGVKIAKRKQKSPMSAANYISIGGVQDKNAMIYISKFRLYNLESEDSISNLIQASDKQSIKEIIADRKKNFSFVLENEKSENIIKITPQNFVIKKGKNYFIDHTAPEGPFTVKAKKDGELTFKLPKIYRATINITYQSTENLISDFNDNWKFNKSSFIPKKKLDIKPVISEKIFRKKETSEEKIFIDNKKLTITKNNGGTSFSAISPPVKVEAGKSYLASAYYIINSATQAFAPCFELKLFKNGALAKTSGNQNHNYLGFPSFNKQDGKWLYAFDTITVPKEWKNDNIELVMYFHVYEAGGSVTWKEPYLRIAPETAKHIGQLAEQFKEPNIEKVKSEQLKRPILTAKVVKKDNQVYVEINNKKEPFIPLATTNAGLTKVGYDQGIRTFAVQISINHWGIPSKSIWKGENEYDFSLFEKKMAEVLEQAPDAKIIIQFMGLAYNDFILKYPNSKWIDGNGKTNLKFFNWVPEVAYNIASKEIRSELTNFMEMFAKHIASSPLSRSIIGVQINGGSDGQWYPPIRPWHFKNIDYSEATRLAVVEIIREQYNNDIKKLQASWNDSTLTFETIKLPTQEEFSTSNIYLNPRKGSDLRCIELIKAYYKARLQGIEALILAFKSGINKPILGLIYAPENIFFDRNDLYNSKVIDGFVSLPGYLRTRAVGGAPFAYGHANGSIKLHNKIHIHEIDFRGEYADFTTRTKRRWLGMGDNLQEYEATNLRNLAVQFCSGAYNWFRTIGSRGCGSYNGVFGNILNKGEMLAKDILDEDKVESKPQVAVFFDAMEQARMSNKNNKGHMLNYIATSLPGLTYSGLTTEYYLIEDLKVADKLGAKIFIFTSCSNLSNDDIKYIEKNLQKNGNVLIFSTDVGGYYLDKFEKNIRTLTGMTVKSKPNILVNYTSRPQETIHEASYNPMGASRWARDFEGPLFYIDDSDAEILSVHSDADLPSVAIKHNKTWSSVYIGNSMERSLSSSLLRYIAKLAQINPVGPKNDFTTMGNGLLMIHAASTGEKLLNWGFTADLKDAFSNKIIAKKCKSYKINMKYGETKVFKLTK